MDFRFRQRFLNEYREFSDLKVATRGFAGRGGARAQDAEKLPLLSGNVKVMQTNLILTVMCGCPREFRVALKTLKVAKFNRNKEENISYRKLSAS